MSRRLLHLALGILGACLSLSAAHASACPTGTVFNPVTKVQ